MQARRLIVFDVDGTLIDSQQQILDSMALAFKMAGLPMPTRKVALSVVGLSLPEAMARLMPEVPDGDRAELLDAYRQGFAASRTRAASPLYPGARATLEGLTALSEVVLGVATGKSRRGLAHLLDQHDLNRFFATTQVADDHPSKPHPSMLEAALREAGGAPQTAVMIGDTTFDMEMGRAAGFRTIGVTWGYHDADKLRAAGADRLVSDFPALTAALEGYR